MTQPPEPSDPTWRWFPFVDQRRDECSYRFVAPGIAISGDHVQVKIEGGSWVMIQEEDGHRWEARHPNRIGCLLELIAVRAGVRE